MLNGMAYLLTVFGAVCLFFVLCEKVGNYILAEVPGVEDFLAEKLGIEFSDEGWEE